MSRWPRAVIALGMVAAASAAPAFLGRASAGEAMAVHTRLVANAWYTMPAGDSCTAPIGCPPVNAPLDLAFPAGSFHEEAHGGQEVARAYVVPDLSALPADATIVSGTVRLPIDTSSQAGTVDTHGATLRACLVTSPVSDGIHGSTNTAPSVDCRHSAPVRLVDETVPAATFDISPFLALWQQGVAREGVALVPAASTSPASSWSITFNGHAEAGVPTPAVDFSYQPRQVAQPSVPTPAATVSAPPVDAPDPVPGPVVAVPTMPPLTAVAPQPSAPAVAAPPSEPVVATADLGWEGFRYSAVFLLPLALVAAGGFLCRTFLTEATPSRMRNP